VGYVRRSTLPDGFFHVISRGVNGRDIYVDADDRRRFLGLLSDCETAYAWTTHAFCLMTTHYHLVLEASREQLSKGLQWLNGRYALTFNRRHGRFGHLFAERFATRVIESEEYLFDACAYVVQNPVSAGMCTRVEDWPWSYTSYGLESS
jgi:REP element-mobilizing transposase RayT